jgi:hypothetical protein
MKLKNLLLIPVEALPVFFPFENLLEFIWASNYKTVFLYYYHCMEFLYQPWALYKMYDEIYPDETYLLLFRDFVAKMTDDYKVRKSDNQAIQELCEYIRTDFKVQYDKILIPVRAIQQSPTTETIDKFLYALRNQIVHRGFRSESDYKILDAQWEQLLEALIPCLPIWYARVKIYFEAALKMV